MRIFSVIALILLAFLILYLALYIFVLRLMFKKILGKESSKKRLTQKAKLIDEYKIDLCYFDKFKMQKLSVISHDEFKLVGNLIHQSDEKLAIILHGYRCDYKEMSNYAKLFIKMGYSIFLPQQRGHGESEGFISMGEFERKDVLVWLKVLITKFPNAKIVIFGLSMGASTTLLTSDEQLLKQVKCLISDSAYENAYKQIKYVYNPKNKKLKNFILENFNKYLTRAYNLDLKKVDAGKAISKTSLPILFIHGKSDNYVPLKNAYNLEEKVPLYIKNVCLIENADHAKCIVTNYLQYEKSVREFLKKWGM